MATLISIDGNGPNNRKEKTEEQSRQKRLILVRRQFYEGGEGGRDGRGQRER